MCVEVKWTAIDYVPNAKLAPLDTRSRLTVSPLNSEALLPAGQLTRSARFGEGDEVKALADQLARIKGLGQIAVGADTGLVVPGTTIEFDAMETPGQGRRVSVAICPQAGNVKPMVAVRIDDFAKAADAAPKPVKPATTISREMAIVDVARLEEGAVLLVPMKFEGTPWRGLIAWIDVHPAGPSDQALLAALQTNLAASGAAARGATTKPSDDAPAIAGAIGELDRGDRLRSPLLFIATRTGAAIAADFVLVADDATLGKLADEVKKSPQAEKLGWVMDRAAVELMCADAETEAGGANEFESLLSLYAGEAGRHPDALIEIVKTIGSRKDLDQRLIAENTIYLEDNAPASRVRAFDWLSSRGKAPAKFDPLGDPKSRRAAIDNAVTASEVRHD
jgi:hypothetical protein